MVRLSIPRKPFLLLSACTRSTHNTRCLVQEYLHEYSKAEAIHTNNTPPNSGASLFNLRYICAAHQHPTSINQHQTNAALVVMQRGRVEVLGYYKNLPGVSVLSVLIMTVSGQGLKMKIKLPTSGSNCKYTQRSQCTRGYNEKQKKGFCT